MGVPYYFYVLMKNYPKILHTSTPLGCTDLFVDFNGAIHHAANIVLAAASAAETTTDAVLQQTWAYLQDCVGIAKPSKTVHICTDGVAPIAKMFQQRKRRYLAMWRNNQDLSHAPIWDRNMISPGTPFMARLQAYISQQIRDRDNHNDKYYYFSSAEEAGEGEHKIFARIAMLEENSKIIIHGLDADLIMLSLISHRPNIYLMREPSGSYKDMQTSDGFMYVEIDKLREAILRDLRITYEWPVGHNAEENAYDEHSCNVIESYVALCSILGNDFLPHPVTLPLKKNGYDTLLMAAKRAWTIHERLIEDNANLNYAFLAEVVKEIAAIEDADLWKLNEEYLKRKPHVKEDDPLDSWPLEHKHPLYNVIYTHHPAKWRAFYYKHLFYTKMHDTSIITTSCCEFLRGITWVFRYYKRLPKDAQWYYPYNYAPTFRDLANFASGMTALDCSNMTRNFTTPHNTGYVSPNVQLLCIMPLSSVDILPQTVRKIMTDDAIGCTHMFPRQFDIQTYMKMHLWECTPVLPTLDIELFEKVV